MLGLTQPPLQVTPLPDGISITGGETLHPIVASWDIFVTLEPPSFPEDLATQMAYLSQAYDAIVSLKELGVEVDLTSYELRQNHLARLLDLPEKNHRQKRGLLDVGGSILHTLFGVATNSQLQRFKDALSEVSGSQSAMSHSISHLATIVNQTRININRLANHQHQIDAQILALHSTITSIDKTLNQYMQRLTALELNHELDKYLNILTIAANEYEAQLTMFHRQRAELELGHLTRDLLPQEHLEEILLQASAHYKVLSSVEWSYQYLTVTPIWQQSDALIYRVELPLIAPRPYLIYHVLAHPVPIGNSSFSVFVRLEKSYAIDTMSGNLFVPETCIGHDPAVCQNGPEYGPELQRCARGILTNRPELIATCSISVMTHFTTPSITKVEVNQYALTTMGETIIVRCPGVEESHQWLDMGTYNLTCIKPCTITGKGWYVTCIDRLYLSRRYVMPAVRVTAHFNFTRALNVEIMHNALPQLQVANAPAMLDMDALALLSPAPTIKNAKPNGIPTVLILINLSLIVSVWAILSFAYLQYRRSRAARKRDNIQLPEALPLTSVPMSEDSQPPPVNRIWPILPPLSDCMSHTATRCSQPPSQ